MRVEKHGELIANFENEPKNLVAMQAYFKEKYPQAMHVFVDTVLKNAKSPWMRFAKALTQAKSPRSLPVAQLR